MYDKDISFPEIEEKVLEFWRRTDAFEKCKELSKDHKEYIFYDGPPFATGLPHYGHLLGGTVKDTIGRFAFQQGFRVDRRFGWDCHGLPVEYEIDKKLKITDRKQVLEMGIDKYNEECKGIVMKYSKEWERTVERMGRWVDFADGYRTTDSSFMESTWFIFKSFFEKNKIYRGYKVMPFSTACKTPLSNFEANQNYKDTSDPSILVSFPLCNKFKGLSAEMVAWTTTPWTLPSNCLLIINESFNYSLVEYNGRNLILHEERVAEYFKNAKIIEVFKGTELLNLEYSPPFKFYESLRSRGFFRIISAEFVSCGNGTAVVHCAPGFGEEDYNTCVSNGLIDENGEAPCPVDENGCFTLEPYAGIYIKDLDPIIIKDIKDKILMKGRIIHSYPFCWRSDTPLIYRLVPNWFIKVKEARDSLLKNNELINWIPEDIKYKKFHNWLEQCRDWAVGRNRFWGTPIPIWATPDYSSLICVGSLAELEKLSGSKVTDLHREYVDEIIIRKDGKEYRRVEEVLDCWFESGSMPYSQGHWPFSTQTSGDVGNFDSLEPPRVADFIGEGIDQTRGWFYTLHVISTLLFDRPAFKNVLVFGIVLSENGTKMSKRLKNYPDPHEIFDELGADSLRLYLINSPVVLAENLRFSRAGVVEITKNLLIPWRNSLCFFMDCCKLSKTNCSLNSTHLMDAWIACSVSNLNCSLKEAGNTLCLNKVAPLALKFIDDLSNWYIRIGRERLRSGEGILGFVLIEFATLMAPFVPFFSEYSYQAVKTQLAGNNWPVSVHHRMFSESARSAHPFEKAKNVIEGIRQMREKLRIKLKRPLKCATIVASTEHINLLTEFETIVKQECNILKINYEEEIKYQFRTAVKPLFEALKIEPASMKSKIKAIREMNEEKARDLLSGPIDINGTKIERKEVILEREFIGIDGPEQVSRMFGEFGVILNLCVDNEIEDLTEAREFFSFVQKQRKAAGLKIEDDVAVWIEAEEIRRIVGQIYPDVQFGKSGQVVGASEYIHKGTNYRVELFRML